MDIYRLTNRGERLAHSYRAPRTPPWGVIYFLNKRGAATKEQVLEGVPGATSMTLLRLRHKKVITEDTAVDI